MEKDSAAEAAGLRGIRRIDGELYLGDIIISIDGALVRNLDDLRQELDRHKVGDEVTLRIVRDDQDFQVKVILEQVG